MFTNEIVEYCEDRNWLLENYSEFYNNIFLTSPQISRVKLEEILPDKAKYYIETNDGFNGWIWIKNINY